MEKDINELVSDIFVVKDRHFQWHHGIDDIEEFIKDHIESGHYYFTHDPIKYDQEQQLISIPIKERFKYGEDQDEEFQIVLNDENSLKGVLDYVGVGNDEIVDTKITKSAPIEGF